MTKNIEELIREAFEAGWVARETYLDSTREQEFKKWWNGPTVFGVNFAVGEQPKLKEIHPWQAEVLKQLTNDPRT